MHAKCYVHDRSERVTRFTHVTCFECGHVFTRLGLRLRHMRVTFGLLAMHLPYEPLYVWGAVKGSVGRIYVCPVCTHDL